jgi:uncharacterized damage-inducible protein DinB
MFRHNLWANLSLLDVCASLDDAQLDRGVTGAYGSLIDTLVHLCAAEGRYVELLRGRQPDMPFREGDRPGFDALRASAQRSGADLVAISESIDAGSILRGTRRGEPYELRAFIPIVQAINHATEHRSHVMTILTQLGIEPPVLDAWHWNEDPASRD